MRSRSPYMILLAGFFILFLLGQFLFTPKAYLSSRLGQALQAPVIFFRNLFTREALSRHLSALELENQSLRAQIATLQNDPVRVKKDSRVYLRVPVYSTYPFNTQNRLYIAAGSNSGVASGTAALVAPDIFTGAVTELEKNRATVRTIFDPGWQLPVRIGEERVEALFVGGQEPKLTLISKKKTVQPGQAVYLSSQNYPLGLTLGTVAEVRELKESLFNEALLAVPYTLTGVNNLFLLNK